MVSNAGLLRLSHLCHEQKHAVGSSLGGGEDWTELRVLPLKWEGMLLHGIKATGCLKKRFWGCKTLIGSTDKSQVFFWKNQKWTQKTLRFAQNWPEAASPLELKVLLPWQQIFISKRVPLKSATSSFDPDSPRDKFSVCDCENKCGGIDTLGLRLMHFCLRNLPPLATPSLRRILMPGMMGELAWGSELHSLLMSAPL